MKALTWQGVSDVRVDNVPDPTIERPDDIIVRITSTGLCGSDLHLYTVLAPYLDAGDVLGHEPMGVVEATGPALGASALHVSPVRPPYLDAGDVLGQEPMGVVEATGPDVTAVAVGDRV